MSEMYDAVKSRDLLALIQVYAEGVELMEPLPETGQVRSCLAPLQKQRELGLHIEEYMVIVCQDRLKTDST